MWRYQRVGASTVICNHPCKVRMVRLYYNNQASTAAIIYNEDTASTTNIVGTLGTLGNGGDPSRISDVIDFGEQGADFFEGCYVAWTAGEILVLYKD